MNKPDFDLFIIGGGVNGCGVARDAAGRGYRVGLAEADDLASGTSSKSTKLAHGGLRYLESGAFGLVRESLREREALLRIAPHLVEPLRFILPLQAGMRPAWLLRLGLFLYDQLGGRSTLPPAASLDLRDGPLQERFRRAFAYSDCQVDDARLVLLNARDAADRGAAILPRTQVVFARPEDGQWRIGLRDAVTGREREQIARLLINASGPWADKVFGGLLAQEQAPPRLRLVRGSHLVVKKLFDGGAYLFQTPDGRVVFAIAWQEDFTLIGTTDIDAADPGDCEISPDEIDYLLRAANDAFAQPIAREDIVWSFSGLRPLVAGRGGAAQRATRESLLEKRRIDGAPLIELLGGKLTSYRRFAEKVVTLAEGVLGPRDGRWTDKAPLPGGDFSGGVASLAASFRAEWPFLSQALATRLARAYGTEAKRILARAQKLDDLGEDFGAGLHAAEIDHLVAREWARTPDDILWRRSKLGLRFQEIDRRRLAAYLTPSGSAS